MKTIQIPGVSFSVTQFCLGCAYLGSRESKDASYAIMDRFFEMGGRFFNTAHEYGDGASETVVGSWIRDRNYRDQLILTSKCGEDNRLPGSRAMHRAELWEDIDESLQRTGLDYLDFYLLHLDDESVPVEEILDTMEEIRKSGKIRYYGCSNWSPDRQKAADRYALKKGYPGFVIDEIEFNLARNNRSNRGACKWMDESFLELHNQDGKCVGAYSPLATGIFSRYAKEETPDDDLWLKKCSKLFQNPYNLEVAKRVRTLSRETGWSASQIQLSWLTQYPCNFPLFCIVGASRVSQLEDSLGGQVILTPDMMDYLQPNPQNYPEGIRFD